MIERFKSLLTDLNISASEFADRIGIQRSSVSHVLSGRNKPSLDFIEKIATAFPEVDIVWLITGKAAYDKTSGVAFDAATVKAGDSSKGKGQALQSKPPAPSSQEPVDYIIVVYKNNSFRILNPA